MGEGAILIKGQAYLWNVAYSTLTHNRSGIVFSPSEEEEKISRMATYTADVMITS